jgi:hypothetical protein
VYKGGSHGAYSTQAAMLTAFHLKQKSWAYDQLLQNANCQLLIADCLLVIQQRGNPAKVPRAWLSPSLVPFRDFQKPKLSQTS